ncbi:restriction endonuclease subunit S [Lactobacillus delbrueckii subsp. bulgaricus]|uniref:restriction endonuclease subunit S n=1 Tax=Lactobacillus delbrueckii TaxID=1584 RepID=UPI00069152DB|nr:restriction endonuclease subunit S [Lactobacillus delbrueckii]MCT3468790.1 restriction endonuclease subunit S [Lactobacillus delbrueckii subsp. bulgaricus]
MPGHARTDGRDVIFAWEQCKLGDVTSSYSGGTPTAGTSNYYGGAIPFIRSGEISKDSTELTITEEGLNNSAAKLVKRGDILYALYGATSGEVSISRLDGAINQAILAIKPCIGYDSYLLMSLLKNEKKKIREKFLQGGQGNLSARIVKNIKLDIPSINEQTKIGCLLLQLDRTITLHEEKKHQLERLKSALLQKMFADKSGYPPVRFEGFSNEWEHCKLGDVADITTGSRNHQDSVTDGKYPFFVRSDKVERLNEYDFDTKAILVPGDGRIGEIFHYYNGKFALHQRVYKVDNFNGINELFLLGLFKYSFKEHALRLNAQGTVPSLRLPMFTNWSISVPMIIEQERIGVFFQKLEQTISLYDHKLELLKKVKRSMLQAMFI